MEKARIRRDVTLKSAAGRHGGGVATPFRRLVICGLVLAFAAFRNFPLVAQTNLETNAGVQFNFSTPGAGNLGLGGAFLGLAFDASAAYTNPAGLTVIGAPEALVELRQWNYTHVFTDRGRLAGDPIAGGFDNVRGLREGQAKNQVTGLSYLAYVYPSRDWSWAVFRHELVNFEADFATHGPYLDATIRGHNPFGIPGTRDGRLAALQSHMTVDIVAYGGATACRLARGFSLGLAISYFDFSIDTIAHRFLPEFSSPPCFPSDQRCPTPDLLVNFQTQEGNDQNLGLAVGLLWESPRKRWSAGGVFRQGPDFSFHARSQPGDDPNSQFKPHDQKTKFHVPDVYGVGLAYRPNDAWRVAFDYDRVRYSRLTHGFVDIFDLASLAQDSGQVEPLPAELDRFEIDDADELHLGIEHAFLRLWPVVSVRLGAWYDPDHSLRFEGMNAGFRAAFRRRGDHVHLTAGMGLAVRHLQLDAAVDYSSRISVVSLSAGRRF